jgi:hypothetical protein
MSNQIPIPEPPRPLEDLGQSLWNAIHERGDVRGYTEPLLILCEALDERGGLRKRVAETAEWRDRVALRALDQQIVDGLRDLGLRAVLPARSDDVADDWTVQLARVYKGGDGVIRTWSDAEWEAKNRRFALDAEDVDR